MIPWRKNTPTSPKNIQELVFTVELAVAMMPRGVETIAFFMDFSKTSYSNMTGPAQSKEVLHILQMHYPERLGIAHAISGNSKFCVLIY
jgi:hypothetical protein